MRYTITLTLGGLTNVVPPFTSLVTGQRSVSWRSSPISICPVNSPNKMVHCCGILERRSPLGLKDFLVR